LFVATFFGTPTMNVISGRVVQNGSCRFQAPHLDLELPARAVPEGAMDQEVCLGVRAEHVQIGADGVPGEVQLTEPLGDETLVFFDYGGDTQLVAKVDGEREYKVGDRMHFTYQPSGLLFFNPHEGTRL
jgi:multiple sugar transport system ATP-binding protein